MMRISEERTSFCEQKEAKKLCLRWATGARNARLQISKSFLVLFFKKERLS
jgi:hypothetical protein